MTGIVKTYSMRELAWKGSWFHNIVKKLHYIHCFLSSDTLMFALQQGRIIETNKSSTRHRWCHDIVESLKKSLKLFSERKCLVLKSSICHWLSTTGLLHRISDIESQMREQLVGGNSHFGKNGIHIARNEKSYFHR